MLLSAPSFSCTVFDRMVPRHVIRLVICWSYVPVWKLPKTDGHLSQFDSCQVKVTRGADRQ